MSSSDHDTAEVHVRAAPGGAGGLLARLDALAAQNRQAPDPDVEREMAGLRHRSFAELVGSAAEGASTPWPPDVPDRFVGCETIPEVGPGELDAEVLASAIVHHGCLIVRGLLPPMAVARARNLVASAYAAQDAAAGGEPDPAAWFEMFRADERYDLAPSARLFNRAGGGLWVGDSPRGMAELVEVLEDVGVRDLVTEHLGGRPAMAFRKWILRTVEPTQGPADWHQDGAFLGTGMRTVNLWVALDECGVHAPGMEIVPRRLDGVLPTGTEGANFSWSVAPDVVAGVAADSASVEPSFAAGDAAFFDELLLHRTSYDPAMRRSRLALESWFFSPSDYPDGEIPLVF